MLRGTVKWFNNKKVMVLLIPTAKKKTCLFILRHWKSPDCAVCPKVRGSILTFMTTAAARLPATLPFELTVWKDGKSPSAEGLFSLLCSGLSLISLLDSRAKHGNDRGEEKNTGMTGKNKSTGMTEEELSLLSAASFMSSSASSLSYSGLTRISKK